MITIKKQEIVKQEDVASLSQAGLDTNNTSTREMREHDIAFISNLSGTLDGDTVVLDSFGWRDGFISFCIQVDCVLPLSARQGR